MENIEFIGKYSNILGEEGFFLFFHHFTSSRKIYFLLLLFFVLFGFVVVVFFYFWRNLQSPESQTNQQPSLCLWNPGTWYLNTHNVSWFPGRERERDRAGERAFISLSLFLYHSFEQSVTMIWSRWTCPMSIARSSALPLTRPSSPPNPPVTTWSSSVPSSAWTSSSVWVLCAIITASRPLSASVTVECPYNICLHPVQRACE